jgi:hypothetical protein
MVLEVAQVEEHMVDYVGVEHLLADQKELIHDCYYDVIWYCHGVEEIDLPIFLVSVRTIDKRYVEYYINILCVVV